VGRYQGSIMGLLWSFLNPVLLLTVYTLVFSGVFKSRWAGADTGHTQFAVVLFSGMLVHGLFAEVLNRAPSIVVGNGSYVKKVVFPLEVLSVVSLGASLFHTAVSLIVLVLASLLLNGAVPWTLVLLPVVLLPLCILSLGCSWVLASLGVYLRDVGQVVGVLTTVLLFLSPVFFPLSAIPERWRSVMLANPLTFIIEQSRNVLIWGRLPDWTGLGLYCLAALLFAWLGYAWFQKTRKGFADVL